MQFGSELVARPHDPTRLIAWSFMVGSALFALGSIPPYSQRVLDPGVVGSTFALGSVWFTAAAYGQFVQVVSEAGPGRPGRRRWVGWRPDSPAWWAVAVQLVGTLLFNISTFGAMIDGLTTEETNRLVWAPDMFGSSAFLIASHLAWWVVCGRWWCVQRDNIEWRMAAVNYLGSIFFGVSAIAALTLPTTGEELNATLVNSTTLAGAVCFFFGAYLLLPRAPQGGTAP